MTLLQWLIRQTKKLKWFCSCHSSTKHDRYLMLKLFKTKKIFQQDMLHLWVDFSWWCVKLIGIWQFLVHLRADLDWTDLECGLFQVCYGVWQQRICSNVLYLLYKLLYRLVSFRATNHLVFGRSQACSKIPFFMSHFCGMLCCITYVTSFFTHGAAERADVHALCTCSMYYNNLILIKMCIC
jgi:hypothetical protein